MWFRDTLFQNQAGPSDVELSAYEMISKLAKSLDPGSEKLIFLPWLSGERAPVLDHYARGAFVGLSMSHNIAHMARAVMEGVAFHVRWLCETLEKLGFHFDEVNAIGGGCKSEIWPQIISDVTGRELRIVEHPLEAGAMAAALTVAVGMGIYASMDEVDDLIHIQQVVYPDARHQGRYDEMYQVYRQLYTALAPIYRHLYEIP
jgi:xylulokinase